MLLGFITTSNLFLDCRQTLGPPVYFGTSTWMVSTHMPNGVGREPNCHRFEYFCLLWFCCLGGGGGWSSAGCSLVKATQEDTTCSCNHLTSFAILLVSVCLCWCETVIITITYYYLYNAFQMKMSACTKVNIAFFVRNLKERQQPTAV